MIRPGAEGSSSSHLHGRQVAGHRICIRATWIVILAWMALGFLVGHEPRPALAAPGKPALNAVATSTPTLSATPSATHTEVATSSTLAGPSATESAAPPFTSTSTPGSSPTGSSAVTNSPTPPSSMTPTQTPGTGASGTPSPSAVPGTTLTASPSATGTPTPTATVSMSPTSSATPSPTGTLTATQTSTSTPQSQAQIAVGPDDPATLPLPNGWGEITFPAGLVPTLTYFTYVEIDSPSAAITGFGFAGRAFSLNALDSEGVPVNSFASPFRIALTYAEIDWLSTGIADEGTLNLYHWDGSTWVGLLPCEGCLLDTDNNQVVVMVDHLTEFALLAPLVAPTSTPTLAAMVLGPGHPLQPLPGGPAHNGGIPYSSTTDSCAACHRVHTARGWELRQSWPEEAVCLTCHNGTGASTDVSGSFLESYRHSIQGSAGLHITNEGDPQRFQGAYRHVECEDCHDPHNSASGLHPVGSNYAGNVLQGAWGIGVSNGPAGAVPGYSIVYNLTYEYQLCLKCHSSWSSPGAGTDVSVEFNPSNLSHHAVEGVGRNQPGAANPNFALTFTSLWGPQSTVACSDCHGSANPGDPKGPHGSARAWLLRGNETGQGTAAVFCYNCHRRDVYGDADLMEPANQEYSRFSHPKERDHTEISGGWGSTPLGIWCLNCHGGSGQGALHGTNLGLGSSGETPLGTRFMNGAFVNGWTAAGVSGDKGTCWASCHPGSEEYKANYDYPP